MDGDIVQDKYQLLRSMLRGREGEQSKVSDEIFVGGTIVKISIETIGFRKSKIERLEMEAQSEKGNLNNLIK
jgi:hypothetical protein